MEKFEEGVHINEEERVDLDQKRRGGILLFSEGNLRGRGGRGELFAGKKRRTVRLLQGKGGISRARQEDGTSDLGGRVGAQQNWGQGRKKKNLLGKSSKKKCRTLK